VGPYDDEKLGFYKVAKYYYYPGWWEPSANLSYLINLDAWKELPEIYQSVIQVATTIANQDMQAKFDYLNPTSLKRILEKGVVLRKFSDEILNEAYKITKEIMEETAKENPSYKKVYESWKKFQTLTKDWLKLAELTFESFNYQKS
ncbi:MAG: ABC transporter substrate-binding protein, partial [Leptospiraceae bacterium]|nr:ABC transporter substrate-binding protein [Leptospiraceae bacterium]